jgi:hypothetical protein
MFVINDCVCMSITVMVPAHPVSVRVAPADVDALLDTPRQRREFHHRVGAQVSGVRVIDRSYGDAPETGP